MSPNGDRNHESPVHPGDTVGPYEIRDELGHGGMGVVFRAHDSRMDRNVALKFPWADLAEHPRARKRFLREIKNASRLAHRNIVPVLDSFEHAGLPCLVMPLIKGENLSDLLLHRGKLPPLEAIQLATQLANAIDYAHREGVLHRDVNPRNILLGDDRCPMLSDFGLSRTIERKGDHAHTSGQTTTLTEKGAAMGTPHYMPPEQALGKTADERSDLYALGAVIYEMCTGTAPFAQRTEGAVLLEAILHQVPDPLSRYASGIPGELDRIVQKLLQKRAKERYQSAADLLVDLRSLQRRLEADEYNTDHGITPVPEPAYRTLPLVFGLVSVALIAATFTWIVIRDPDRLPEGDPIPITRTAWWEGEPVLSPDGERLAFTSNVNGNLDVLISDLNGGEPLVVTRDPATDRSPVWLQDGAGILFVSDRTGSDCIWKTGPLGGEATLMIESATDPALSPDGRWIAFARLTPPATYKRILIANLENLEEWRWLTEETLRDHAQPAWSPDGASICYSEWGELRIVPVAGGAPASVTETAGWDCDPAWSANQQHIYFTSYRAGPLSIWRVRVKDGRVQRVTLGSGFEHHPNVSKDGRCLAYATGTSRHEIVIHDLQTGDERAIPGLTLGRAPAFSPSLDQIVFTAWGRGNHATLWVQPLEDLQPSGPPRPLLEQSGVSSQAVFSPDGRWIAYFRVDAGKRDIWIVPAHGGRPARLTEHDGLDAHPAWSPDGTRIAFLSDRDGSPRIYTAPVKDGARTADCEPLSPAGLSAFDPVWARDGSRVAFSVSTQNGYSAWTVNADGGNAREIPASNGAQRKRWAPDDESLLISGLWEGETMSLRRIAAAPGDQDLQDDQEARNDQDDQHLQNVALTFGGSDAAGYFDLSSDGRFVVYERENPQGDVWVLKTTKQPY